MIIWLIEKQGVSEITVCCGNICAGHAKKKGGGGYWSTKLCKGSWVFENARHVGVSENPNMPSNRILNLEENSRQSASRASLKHYAYI